MANTMVDAAFAAAGGPSASGDKSGARLKPGEDPGGGGPGGAAAGSMDQLSTPNPDVLRKTLEDVIR